MDIYKIERTPSEHTSEMLKRSLLKRLKPKFRHPKPEVTQMQENRTKEKWKN